MCVLFHTFLELHFSWCLFHLFILKEKGEHSWTLLWWCDFINLQSKTLSFVTCKLMTQTALFNLATEMCLLLLLTLADAASRFTLMHRGGSTGFFWVFGVSHLKGMLAWEWFPWKHTSDGISICDVPYLLLRLCVWQRRWSLQCTGNVHTKRVGFCVIVSVCGCEADGRAFKCYLSSCMNHRVWNH